MKKDTIKTLLITFIATTVIILTLVFIINITHQKKPTANAHDVVETGRVFQENTYNVDSAAAIQSIHQNYSKWYKQQYEGKGFGMPTPDMDTVWLLLGYAWKLSDDSEHGYGTLTVTASKYDTLSRDSLRYYVEKLNNVKISPKHFFITSFHQFDTKHEFNLYKNLF